MDRKGRNVVYNIIKYSANIHMGILPKFLISTYTHL